MSEKTFQPHPYRWFLHILVILYYTMGFVARFAWPPLIPVAAPDLNISMSDAGLFMSAFYIGYVLIHIPGGMLGDRFGVRLVIGAALLVEALGTFGVGIAPSFEFGFICRVLTGLGAGAVYSACVRYVASLFPPKETGLAFGLMMMAPGGVGVILPNLIMPWLTDVMGSYGWRGAFQAISLLILIIGVLALVFVRAAPTRKTAESSFVSALLAVLRRKNLVFLALASFWLMWLMVGFVSWSNTYLFSLGFSKEQAAFVMIVYGIGGIIASPLGGVLAGKVSSPKILYMALFALAAPTVWFFGQSSNLATLCALAAACGFILGLTNPILPLLTSMFADKELVATAGGVTGCIFQLGAVIGPWVMGLSMDITGAFSTAWALLSAAPLLGILFLLPLGKQKH